MEMKALLFSVVGVLFFAMFMAAKEENKPPGHNVAFHAQKAVLEKGAQPPVAPMVRSGASPGNGPGTLGLVISGTGTSIDGTWRIGSPVGTPCEQSSINWVPSQSGRAWPQAKIMVNRQVHLVPNPPGPPLRIITWSAGGWVQCSDGGYYVDGSVLRPEFSLVGADPVEQGGDVTGVAQWGLSGQSVTIEVTP